MVGDGHAVSVTAQIAEHLARPAESRFGIDDPIPPVEAAQPLAELFRIGECGGRSGAAELLTAVKAFEAGDELTAEGSSANLQGEKKTGIARRHPTGVIGRD